MKLPTVKNDISKSLLVKVLQWVYLILAVLSIIFVVSSSKIPFITKLGFPGEIFIGIGLAITVYCLILSLSFFTQNTNFLIFSLVLIFFTTIGSLIMLFIAIPNSGSAISGHLPKCIQNLSSCSLKDGIIVTSALLLTTSVPLLILNIITIVGSVKAIAATD